MTPTEPLDIAAGAADLTISPPNAAQRMGVWVAGVEDDSGTFPPDADDEEVTPGSFGGATGPGTPLAFPVGDGREGVSDETVTLVSRHLTLTGGELSFSADIVCSVDHV
ncbi:hypothetical protein ACIBG6_38445 [Streptomyces sp. NPDC050842]|uniref:hypothetical protein n=1 Tax=Streptomyces sp. NPDC050842 TaxID=3365636 RepID=UPI00379A498A